MGFAAFKASTSGGIIREGVRDLLPESGIRTSDRHAISIECRDKVLAIRSAAQEFSIVRTFQDAVLNSCFEEVNSFAT